MENPSPHFPILLRDSVLQVGVNDVARIVFGVRDDVTIDTYFFDVFMTSGRSVRITEDCLSPGGISLFWAFSEWAAETLGVDMELTVDLRKMAFERRQVVLFPLSEAGQIWKS